MFCNPLAFHFVIDCEEYDALLIKVGLSDWNSQAIISDVLVHMNSFFELGPHLHIEIVQANHRAGRFDHVVLNRFVQKLSIVLDTIHLIELGPQIIFIVLENQ